jgi:hypothetical protein
MGYDPDDRLSKVCLGEIIEASVLALSIKRFVGAAVHTLPADGDASAEWH